jgi:LDH2 family malate/lactate/ureidoglycolate dehydrogenase
LDAAGEPTTDPAAYLDGGHLIIFGEHKGYAMSLLTCLLGALSGGLDTDTGYLGGSFFVAIDPSAFLPPGRYTDGVASFLDGIRQLAPEAGREAVLVPGDVEASSRSRRSNGLPVSAAVRQALIVECDRLGVRHGLG